MRSDGVKSYLTTIQSILLGLMAIPAMLQALPGATIEYVAPPIVAEAYVEEVVVSSLKIESVEEKITRVSIERNFKQERKLYNIVEGESLFDPNAIGDMNIICKQGPNAGKPVRARGLVQITDCAHPEVTDEQAFDPEWSLNWAIDVIERGEEWKEWTICSCKKFAQAMGSKLHIGDADDFFPNTEVPVVGGVIIMKYKNGQHHLIPITKNTIKPDGLHAVSANKEPCKITREIIPYNSKEIMGYHRYAQDEM